MYVIFIYCSTLRQVHELNCLGKSNSIISQVKLCVIWSHENSTKYPQGATWGWNVNANEATDANGFTELCEE